MKEVHFYLDLNLRLSKTKTSNRVETKEEDVKFRYVALRLNLLQALQNRCFKINLEYLCLNTTIGLNNYFDTTQSWQKETEIYLTSSVYNFVILHSHTLNVICVQCCFSISDCLWKHTAGGGKKQPNQNKNTEKTNQEKKLLPGWSTVIE